MTGGLHQITSVSFKRSAFTIIYTRCKRTALVLTRAEVAEYRERSQLVGEYLREAAVLIGVLWPLEDGIKNGKVSGTVLTFALLASAILLYWGVILEGREGL